MKLHNEKVNVLIIGTVTRVGGTEMRMIEYLRHSSGNDLLNHFVCCTSAVPDMLSRLRQTGVPVFVPKRHFHYDPSAILQMVQFMRANKIHIIHSRDCVSNCWGGLAAALAGVPIKIGGEHGVIWEMGPPKSWIERFVYRFFDLVLTNSPASKTMVAAKRGVDPAKIRVLLDGVDAAPYEIDVDVAAKKRELGIPQDHKVVGSVGRLETAKGFHVFIEAAAQVLEQERDVTFVLVGDGPLRDKLEAHARTMRLESRFLFTGVRHDVPELMRAFDVFVSTSIREPLGNVVIEAQYSKVPVIVPAVDGIVEIVKNGETGILLEPTEPVDVRFESDVTPLPKHVIRNGKLARPKALNPERLASSILDMLRRPDLSEQIRQSAYESARDLFSLERYANNLDEIYLKHAREKGII